MIIVYTKVAECTRDHLLRLGIFNFRVVREISHCYCCSCRWGEAMPLNCVVDCIQAMRTYHILTTKHIRQHGTCFGEGTMWFQKRNEYYGCYIHTAAYFGKKRREFNLTICTLFVDYEKSI